VCILCQVLKRKESKICFNFSKLQLRVPDMQSGTIITAEGMKPDPNKVEMEFNWLNGVNLEFTN